MRIRKETLEKAKDVLGYNYKKWFDREALVLGGLTPREYLNKTGDYDAVENILCRIEHGIFQ
jgi:hypothetical protein